METSSLLQRPTYPNTRTARSPAGVAELTVLLRSWRLHLEAAQLSPLGGSRLTGPGRDEPGVPGGNGVTAGTIPAAGTGNDQEPSIPCSGVLASGTWAKRRNGRQGVRPGWASRRCTEFGARTKQGKTDGGMTRTRYILPARRAISVQYHQVGLLSPGRPGRPGGPEWPGWPGCRQKGVLAAPGRAG
jgi:hypothetical protein